MVNKSEHMVLLTPFSNRKMHMFYPPILIFLTPYISSLFLSPTTSLPLSLNLPPSTFLSFSFLSPSPITYFTRNPPPLSLSKPLLHHHLFTPSPPSLSLPPFLPPSLSRSLSPFMSFSIFYSFLFLSPSHSLHLSLNHISPTNLLSSLSISLTSSSLCLSIFPSLFPHHLSPPL